MHRFIVDIARAGLVQSADRESAGRNAVGLLLVANKMLDRGDDMLLHGNDRLVQQSTGEVGIVAEPFPIATPANDSSKTSAYRSESHICAFALELRSKVILCLVNEGFVPGSTEMEARRVAIDSIGVSNTIAIIYETQARETEPWNTPRHTGASGG
jgi:hypothetical protein